MCVSIYVYNKIKCKKEQAESKVKHPKNIHGLHQEDTMNIGYKWRFWCLLEKTINTDMSSKPIFIYIYAYIHTYIYIYREREGDAYIFDKELFYLLMERIKVLIY